MMWKPDKSGKPAGVCHEKFHFNNSSVSDYFILLLTGKRSAERSDQDHTPDQPGTDLHKKKYGELCR